MSRGYLTIIVLATKGELPEASNSLIVTKDPENPRTAVRVYWRGRRVEDVTVSGPIDATLGQQTVVLIIDDERIEFKANQYITFRGEELRINRDYARTDYDAETDTVF